MLGVPAADGGLWEHRDITTMDGLARFQELVGVVVILGGLFVLSENRRAMSMRMVLGGLALLCELGLVLLRSAVCSMPRRHGSMPCSTVPAPGLRFPLATGLRTAERPSAVFSSRICEKVALTCGQVVSHRSY